MRFSNRVRGAYTSIWQLFTRNKWKIVIGASVTAVFCGGLYWFVSTAKQEHLARYGIWILIAAAGLLASAVFVLQVGDVFVSKESKHKEAVQKWAKLASCGAALTTFAVGIVLKVVNVTLLREDERTTVIREFFSDVDNRKWTPAYQLIHKERLDEISANTKSPFSPERLRHVYENTISHGQPRIEYMSSASPTVASYRVTFDTVEASDDWLVRADYRLKSVREAMADGVLALDFPERVILPAMRARFSLDNDIAVRLREDILDARVGGVFHPKFLSELARERGLPRKQESVYLKTKPVWTHYVLEIMLKREGKEWKIRDGLAAPAIEATWLKAPQGLAQEK